jgi:hypothetical protein
MHLVLVGRPLIGLLNQPQIIHENGLFGGVVIGIMVQVLILNLGVCILLRVLNQVEGFPSNVTLFR